MSIIPQELTMKFSADRTEKKGPLGGAYYETYIKITLTPEEENIARKQGIMRTIIFGGRSSDDPETIEAFRLCGMVNITMEDLIQGITVKVGSGQELGRLAGFEDLIKQRCKNLKSNITADQFFGSGGSKDEEEL
ncbi:hypothetical protein [Microcoleus sp. bin38.metabat.b11b12b14.051]|uniref:hypothetical protein n=1 Tax=Microcoleus sp. bin38.metabat.b11b12b14.051 TaxID=2742709 RepID=UPI0025FD19A1|nr:hypothetical protein [Microcoleus sp. bin38.metabat.b11b12b14.051]